MDPQARIMVLCGKGGVGKTTLSLAFGLKHANEGKRVVIVSSHPLSELAISVSLEGLGKRFPTAARNLFVVHLDPRELLTEVVEKHFPVPLLARTILNSSLFENLVAIAPGLKEFYFLARLQQLAERKRAVAGTDSPDYDFLIWDAPASGPLVNLVSISIFLPFLNPFARLLEKFFKDTDASALAFIGHADIKEPETAMDLFRRETEYFIHNSILFNLALFDIDIKLLCEHPDFRPINVKRKFFSKSPEEKYEFLKHLQGELQAFYLSLRTKVQDEQYAQLNQLISSVRSCMHSVKSMKDVAGNITNLSRSSKNIKFNFFTHHKKGTEDLYQQLNALMEQKIKADFQKLQSIYAVIQDNYSSSLNNFYKEAQNAPIEDLDITTALNFNRELFTSNKAMLMAVKDFLLKEKEANDFNEIPVYKT